MARRKALKGFEAPDPVGRVAEGEVFDDSGLSEADEKWLVKKGVLAASKTPTRSLFKKKVTSG